MIGSAAALSQRSAVRGAGAVRAAVVASPERRRGVENPALGGDEEVGRRRAAVHVLELQGRDLFASDGMN